MSVSNILPGQGVTERKATVPAHANRLLWRENTARVGVVPEWRWMYGQAEQFLAVGSSWAMVGAVALLVFLVGSLFLMRSHRRHK